MVRKDGEEITTLLAASPRYDREDNYLGAHVFYTDITERKSIQQTLHESEEKYRRLFEESGDGLVLVDHETGTILDCNQEFVRQTGRDRKKLLKMKIWEIRPPHLREVARKKFLEVKEKRQGGSMELDFQRPSGEIVNIDFLSRTTRIGDREVIQSRCRDITEYKKAEKALRDSEEK